MNAKWIRYQHLVVIALMATLTLQLPFTLFSYNSTVDFHEHRETFNRISALFADIKIESTRLFISAETDCINQSQKCSEDLASLSSLSNSTNFTQILQLAANQGEWLTKRHEEQVQRVIISLRNTSNNFSRENQLAAIANLEALSTIYNQLSIDLEVEAQKLEVRYLVTSIALSITSLALFLLLTQMFKRSRRIERDNTREKWAQVEEINQLIGRSEYGEVLQQTRRYDPALQSIVERFIANKNSLDSADEDIRLFRRINKSINYEFRSLTNTISGGLRLLSGEMEGKSIVLASEMIQSTEVLDELANNFLGIFGEASSELETDVSRVIDKVISLVRAKSERNHQQLECFVSRYVPDTLQVSPIKLLWSIYLELSKAIDVYRNKNLAIIIDADRELGSEKRRIKIQFYFIDDLSAPLDSISQATWANVEVASHCFADLIFGDDVDARLSTASDSDENVRYTLELVARPAISHSEISPLKDLQFLACGSPGLQTDIISRTIEVAGGSVHTLATPGEIFKAIPKASEYAAIIVTDTVQGLEFKSFLKTLQSRMLATKVKAKLLLSLASQEFDIETTQFVDRVVLRPASPSVFIKSILSVIDLESGDESTEANHIICIDDDMTHGFILTEILEASGWTATHFESPLEGIEYIKENGIRVVFMDCIMPEIDGFEATRKIRAYEAEMQSKRPITIIGATGLTSVSEMNECVEAGMDYVINKPYSQDEIIRVLKTYTAAKKVS